MVITSVAIIQMLFALLTRVKCTTANETLIAIPYQVYFGSYYFHLSIGTPPQDLFHAIDQEREFTWTALDFYHRERSHTVRVLNETKLRFRHLDMYGSILEESLNVTPWNRIDNFPFYVINSTRGFNSRVGGLGFAFKFRDKNYSIIHRLKEDNQIGCLAYSFVPSNETNGTFYLGGIPQESVVNKKSSSCKVRGPHSNWACDLSYVFFGNISYVYDNVYYNNHDYAFFQVADKRILAPENFIDYLNNSYFQPHIKANKCKSQLLSMNREFVCQCDSINALPQFNFIFDDKAYTIKASELFEQNGSQCLFLIASNHIRDKNWLFGTIFLERFNSLFDYEKGSVTFYSNEEIETVDLDKLFPWRKLVRWTFYVILIILFILLMRWLYLRNKRKVKPKKTNYINENYEEMK